MKNIVFIIILIFLTKPVKSQIWLEGFVVHSSPHTAWALDGETTIEVEGYEPVTIPNKDLFKTVSGPTLGGGANFRYSSGRMIVGMEVSYVSYEAKTQLLKLSMFRLGPAVEYFFMPESKLHPYLGGELSLGLSKVKFNGEVTEKPRLSKTYLGMGPRAGLAYMLNDKCALRLGAKYIFLKSAPTFDMTLGLAYNIGDF